MIELLNEVIGLVEKALWVITGQRGAQVVAPVALQLQVGALQRRWDRSPARGAGQRC